MVVEKEAAFTDRIENFERRTRQTLRFSLQERRREVDDLARHGVFQGFRTKLMTLTQRVDELESRAWNVVHEERRRMAEGKSRAEMAVERMASILGRRLSDAAGRAALVEERIAGAFRAVLRNRIGDWERLSATLQAQSPLDVLKKGYAVVWLEGPTRTPVARIEDVRPGAEVAVSFHRGEFSAVVSAVDPEKPVMGAVGFDSRIGGLQAEPSKKNTEGKPNA